MAEEIIMAGIRKQGKINHLKYLNDYFHLGHSETDIENMSVNQLKRMIFDIKKKYNLRIPISSTLRQREIE